MGNHKIIFMIQIIMTWNDQAKHWPDSRSLTENHQNIQVKSILLMEFNPIKAKQCFKTKPWWHSVIINDDYIYMIYIYIYAFGHSSGFQTSSCTCHCRTTVGPCSLIERSSKHRMVTRHAYYAYVRRKCCFMYWSVFWFCTRSTCTYIS